MSRYKFALVKDKEFYQLVLVNMIPVILQSAINVGVNMMDTIMLGKLGEAQISASSLANSYYALYMIVCMGIIGGCSVLAAQYWGKKDIAKTKESFTLGLYFAVSIALLFSVLTYLFPRQIMSVYTKDADVIEYGMVYLRITAYIFLFHGTGVVFSFLMRSVQKPKLGLVVSAVSFFVNIFFNWVFIFGKLGAPRMEIAGAALGTLIARIVEFIITFGYVLIIEKDLGYRPRDMLTPPTKELMFNYRRLGVGALVSDCMVGIGVNLNTMIIGHMGVAVVAAHSVCLVVDRLFNLVVTGMSNAAAVISGKTIGEGKLEQAQKQGETFYLLGIGFGIINGIMMFLFGGITFRFYDLSSETLTIANQMMVAFSFMALFETLQMIITKGVLRGGGDTKFLMIADILFMWVLSIPLGFVAGILFHAPGWLTVVFLRIDWIIKCGWCTGRLKSGKWIRQTQKLKEE